MSDYRQLLNELTEAAENTPEATRASAAQCALLAVLLDKAGMPSDMVTHRDMLTKGCASEHITALKIDLGGSGE